MKRVQDKTHKKCKMTHDKTGYDVSRKKQNEKGGRRKEWNVFLSRKHTHPRIVIQTHTQHVRACNTALVGSLNQQIKWRRIFLHQRTTGKQGLLLIKNQVTHPRIGIQAHSPTHSHQTHTQHVRVCNTAHVGSLNQQISWRRTFLHQRTTGKQGLLLIKNQVTAHFRICWEQTQQSYQLMKHNVPSHLGFALKHLSHVQTRAHFPISFVRLISISFALVLALSLSCSFVPHLLAQTQDHSLVRLRSLSLLLSLHPVLPLPPPHYPSPVSKWRAYFHPQESGWQTQL